MTQSPAERTGRMPETMNAVICHGPENYRMEEVAVPLPGPGEALVKVEAATRNSTYAAPISVRTAGRPRSR
jgi:hypothetical protein